MSTTPSHQHRQSSRVPGVEREPSRLDEQFIASWIDMLVITPVEGRMLSSGMVTDQGTILRIDRCAPEHGGGLLLMMPGNRQVVVEAGNGVGVFGVVQQEHLDAMRAVERAVTGIDYTAGLR